MIQKVKCCRAGSERNTRLSYLQRNLDSLSPLTLNCDTPSINSEKSQQQIPVRHFHYTQVRGGFVCLGHHAATTIMWSKRRRGGGGRVVCSNYLHRSFCSLSPFTLNCEMPSINSATHMKQRNASPHISLVGEKVGMSRAGIG